MRFVGRIFGDNGKYDLAGVQVLEPLRARNQLALRREDG